MRSDDRLSEWLPDCLPIKVHGRGEAGQRLHLPRRGHARRVLYVPVGCVRRTAAAAAHGDVDRSRWDKSAADPELQPAALHQHSKRFDRRARGASSRRRRGARLLVWTGRAQIRHRRRHVRRTRRAKREDASDGGGRGGGGRGGGGGNPSRDCDLGRPGHPIWR